MKKLVVALGFWFCLMGGTVYAEASVGEVMGKLWSYLFSPVNCVAQLGADLVADGAKFVQCVIENANPSRLIP